MTLLRTPFQTKYLSICLASLFLSAGGAAADAAISNEDFESRLAEVERHVALFRVSESDFQTMDTLLKDRPQDSYARFLLGRCFERRGLIDMASEQFKLADSLQKSPEDQLRRLKHHIEAGELSEAFNMRALGSFSEAKDPALILLHGLFLQENGFTENAEAIFQSLLSRPDCPLGTATALAVIEMQKKNWREAIALAERDLKNNPAYVSAILAEAQSYLALGRGKQAILTLKDALSAHPFNRRLNLLMYQAYRHEGMYAQALYCALLNLAGSDYISFYEDAKNRVQDMLLRLPRAQSDRVVESASLDIARTNYAMKFHFYLAQVYYRMHRRDEARNQIEKALSMVPEFQPNWYQRGRIKELLYGELRSAADDYKAAHKLQRSDYKATVALQRVRARIRNSNRDLALKMKELIRAKLAPAT